MDKLAKYYSGPEQCSAVNYDYNRAKGSFGAQQEFYSFANGMSNILFTKIFFGYDQEERLFNFIYFNKGSMSDIMSDANESYMGITMWVSLSTLICIVVAIGTIWKLCCKCKKGSQVEEQPSNEPVSNFKQLMFTVSNVVLFSLLLAFTIIFGVSVEDLSNGIRSNSVSTSNDWYNYKNGMTDLECSFGKYVTKPFLEQQIQFGQLASETTGIWWKNSGVPQLSMFDLTGYNESLQNTNDMGQQLLDMFARLHPSQQDCKYEMDALVNILQMTHNDTTNIVKSMPEMQETISITISQAQITKWALFNQLLSLTNMQLKTFDAVEERLNTVNYGLQLAGFDAQNYSNIAGDFINKGVVAYQKDSNDLVTVFTLLLVLIPMTIVLIAMLLASGTCVNILLFPKTKLPARITELIYVLIRVGSLTVFFTAWIICSVSIAFLVISNPFATTCYEIETAPSFYYRLPVHYYRYDQKRNDTPFSIDYGEFRTLLQSQATLFDALGSVNIQNISAVIEDLSIQNNLLAIEEFIAYANLIVYFNDNTYYTFLNQSNHLNSDTSLLASEVNYSQFLSDCKEFYDVKTIQNSMVNYLQMLNSLQKENAQLLKNMKNVMNFNENDTRLDMNIYVDGVYTNADITLSNSLQEYQNQLSRTIYPANAITAVYDRTFDVLCFQIRSPIDGIWTSASFLGLFMLLAGFVLKSTAHRIDKSNELDAEELPATTPDIKNDQPKETNQVVPKTPDPKVVQSRYENITTTVEEATDHSAETIKPQPALYPTIDPNALTDLEQLKFT